MNFVELNELCSRLCFSLKICSQQKEEFNFAIHANFNHLLTHFVKTDFELA